MNSLIRITIVFLFFVQIGTAEDVTMSELKALGNLVGTLTPEKFYDYAGKVFGLIIRGKCNEAMKSADGKYNSCGRVFLNVTLVLIFWQTLNIYVYICSQCFKLSFKSKRIYSMSARKPKRLVTNN